MESRLVRRVPGFLALAPASPEAIAASGRRPGSVEFVWATGSEPESQGIVDRLMVDRRSGEVLWREECPGWGFDPTRAGAPAGRPVRRRASRTQPTLL